MEASESIFDTSMLIKDESRISPRKGEALSAYVQLSRELRSKLAESIEEEGIPPVPESCESLEDLFEQAGEKVSQRWQNWSQGVLDERIKTWREQIPDNEENTPVIELLKNPNALEKAMKVKAMTIWESLRSVHPEAWRSLVLASSERQLAEIFLLRRWLRDFPEEFFEKIGISRNELRLLTDVSGILGKYVDHGFIKQMEYADRPGGSEPTKLADKLGAEYVYELPTDKDGEDEIRTYTEMFSFEIPAISKRLQAVAKRTQRWIEKGSLNNSYQLLPAYLEKVSEVYASSEKDPEKLNEIWSDLYEKASALAKSGCPLILIPQGAASVTGEAGKVDIEIRVAFRTKDTRALEEKLKAIDYQRNAQTLLDQYQEVLSETRIVPDVVINYQPFAFGPNLYAKTRGESDKSNNLVHTNAVWEIARESEIPLLQKIFGRLGVTEEEYRQLITQETALHEFAHSVIPTNDENIRKKIGTGSDADIIEELKAETVGAILFESSAEMNASGIENYLWVKIGTNLDCLINKGKQTGGEAYYFTGLSVLLRLFESGALAEEDGQYIIVDHRKGIMALADLGREIISIYSSETTNPETIQQFVRGIRNGEDDTRILKLIKAIS